MAVPISNLREFCEPETHLYRHLAERASQLSMHEGFGPPDCCYLIKEQKGGFMKSMVRWGCFHYVYGVDCSSSASIAVYINGLINDIEAEGWYKKSYKVVKAIFCIYDIVLRRDVRVEITIPGGTHVYAVNQMNEKHSITGIQWNFVFVSSILRSFEPKKAPHIKIVTELDNKELFGDFLIVASNLYKNGYGRKFGDVLDRVKDGSSILLSKIADYLIQKRRISECIDFISPFAEDDPLLIGLICDALFTVDKLKQSITLLAHKIKEFPMLASLLLKQAQAFLKYEYYEYALRLSKILVDLCPESFECWLVLAESYFHVRKFRQALIAIDVAPSYEDLNDEQIFPDMSKYTVTTPKVQNSTYVYSDLMVKPEEPDFRFTENSKASNVPIDYETKVLEALERANTRKLNHCDKKAYELLVKIEKEVSWEVLLRIKSQTFLAEGDEVNGWENPYLNAEYAKHSTDQPGAKGKGKHNESFYAIQKSAHLFLKEKNKNVSHMHEGDYDDTRDIPSQVIKEENYEESKATENREYTAGGDRKRTRTLAKNDILGKATVEDIPVTFASLPSEGEGSDLEEQKQEARVKASKNSRKKRLATKIDKLFLMLYEDLNLLITWENEEKKKVEEKAPDAFNYNGIVWVHRGMLAERIFRKRLAEKAYRNAIERGFSMFTWHRLLEIYSETYNPKACLVCVAEILDQADDDGIDKFAKLPYWIESVVYHLVAVNGLKAIVKLTKEMELEDCKALTNSLVKAQYWQIEGSNS